MLGLSKKKNNGMGTYLSLSIMSTKQNGRKVQKSSILGGPPQIPFLGEIDILHIILMGHHLTFQHTQYNLL
jgi:hypothetical protein